MSKPLSPRKAQHAIQDLSDLSRLNELVVDKRLGQRSAAKKNRRNRHYEKQFIRNSLAHHLQIDPPDLMDKDETIRVGGVLDQ